MTILSIDTSTKVCSVAIHENGNLLAVSELLNEKSSSGMLTTMIEGVAKYAHLSLNEIDAFAIAKGPGSYTGLRIGTATAKGLCFTLDKPLIAINTLDAMAYLELGNSSLSTPNSRFLIPNSLLLCPMLDARRMEVYCAVYESVTLKNILPTEAKIIDATSFSELLEENRLFFFGDGAEKCREIITHKNAIFANKLIYPSAKTVGYLATKAFEKQDFEDLATFEPFYLKDFIMTTVPKKLAW